MKSVINAKRRKPIEGMILAVAFWTLMVVAVVLGLKRWLPEVAPEHGASVDRVIYYLLITVGSLFV